MNWKLVHSEFDAAELLRRSPNRVALHFSNKIKYSQEGTKAFASLLVKNQADNLVGLRFEVQNSRSFPLVPFVISFLLSEACAIKTLWFEKSLPEEDVVALSRALTKNKSIEVLYFTAIKIELDTAKEVARLLVANKQIQELYLNHNGIHDYSAKALGLALKVNKSIEVLDLAHNRIGPEGASFLSAGLQNNMSLRVLNIGFNQLGSAGAGKSCCPLSTRDLIDRDSGASEKHNKRD
jgi:hypothetical protein